MKIFLLEDNSSIAKGLVYSLAQKGFDVRWVSECKAAESAMNDGPYSAAVLDINLPDGNGFDVYKNLIKPAGIPALFLTVRDDEDDIVKCIEAGAEDYMTKPFSTRELIARLNRILGRSHKVITAGDVVFDTEKPEVTRGGEVVPLTSLELKLLTLLCNNSGRVISRGNIIDKIWEWTGNDVNDNTVTVYMKRLRDKLGDDVIVTVKGIGYRFDGR